jgi:hypothetical protein
MNSCHLRAPSITPLWKLLLLTAVVGGIQLPAGAQIWGRLGNPGFNNQRIKATLFFAGQARDGTKRYDEPEYGPDCGLLDDAANRSLYPPLDSPHLKWSESEANRNLALNLMVQAGINVINMSSWGESFLRPCSWDNAPMQLSPEAKDQTFAIAVGKPLLIVPFLESRGGRYPWNFRGEFPQTIDGVAPGTVSQIVDLIDRYLKNAAHPEWAGKWAQVYDQQGERRYAVAIIHAASDLLGFPPRRPVDDHTDFAAGFDRIADEVFYRTQAKYGVGVNVGFFIDALPPASNAPGLYKPSPEDTGPFLESTLSLLGIECFVPEIWVGSSDTAAVIQWKRGFSQRWFQTGVPFLMDVSPGYDGRLAFGSNTTFYGLSTEWLDQLAQMNLDYGRGGMVFNAWNAYSEALVAVPGVERKFPDGTRQFYGNVFYDWLRSLQSADVYARKPDASPPRDGTWTRPYTLAEAIEQVPVGGMIGLQPTTSAPFDAPVTISKPCTLISIGGSARIGQ